MILDPKKRLAGVLAPLFALRGTRDFGIGDVGALREFVDWAADQGFGLVQLLPVNETGNDVDVDREIGDMIENSGTYSTYMRVMTKLYRQMDLAVQG